MARFRYLGETPRPNMVITYGPCTKIRVPSASGTVEYTAVDPELGFIVGQDIGVEITDPSSLRSMRADTRFEEI